MNDAGRIPAGEWRVCVSTNAREYGEGRGCAVAAHKKRRPDDAGRVETIATGRLRGCFRARGFGRRVAHEHDDAGDDGGGCYGDGDVFESGHDICPWRVLFAKICRIAMKYRKNLVINELLVGDVFHAFREYFMFGN